MNAARENQQKNNTLKYRRIVQLPKGLVLTISVVGLLELRGLSSDIAYAQWRQPSRSYCEEYARNYARRNSQGQTLRGAARGAAGGAIIGGIFGDAGTGAAAGAVFGGIRGGRRQSSDYNYLYNIAFDDCMSGRIR
jgi:outer membrane lipoprotein SlyB